MRVRLAREDDIEAMVSIESACFGSGSWSEATLRALMGREDVRALVLEDGSAVAYAMYSVSVQHETAEVLSLAVSPRVRRRGLARSLMEAVEEHAGEEGAGTIALFVRTDNHQARNLYLSLGYKVLALCASYYEDGGDAYLMVKHLE